MTATRAPVYEVLQAEEEVCSGVPKRVLEPVDDLIGTIVGKPLEADGGTGDVATQLLEAVTLMRLAGDGGVEREAFLIGRERFRNVVGPAEAQRCRLEPFKRLAATIKAHWDGILNVFDSRLTNGAVEGMNGLIQAAKARARGYRTARSLITMSYLIGGKLSALPGNPYTTRYCGQAA